MKLQLDAYERNERPDLLAHVKVQMPNDETDSKTGKPTGRKVEAVMEYRQLLDENGKLLPNVEKIEAGYYRFK